MAAPLILVEARPRRAADGTVVTRRLAGGGGERPYYYQGEHWKAGIVDLPTIIASLDFEEREYGTGGVASAAAIEWGAGSASALAEMAADVWNDADITMRIGPEGALPPVALAGRVLQATSREGRLQIALADPAVGLKKPVLTERFAGTGGLEGAAEMEGRLKRRVFGRVWNLPGSPIDAPNNIYWFADPLRPLQAIGTVRDKGAATNDLVELAWQGSAATTFAALRAAEAPEGGGIACPSIACVKWWSQPKGDLTADIEGEVGEGYVETTAGIVERIVAAIDGPAFAAGTLAAAGAARSAPIGWVIDDASTTAAQMLDELLGNVSLLWVLDSTGEIVLREWAWGASTRTAKATSIERSRTFRPIATRTTGYLRNELPMARNSLAAIVLVEDLEVPPGDVLNSHQEWSDVQDGSGTKPEDNATVGAPGDTPVGASTGNQVVSDLQTSAITQMTEALGRVLEIREARARAHVGGKLIQAIARTLIEARIDPVTGKAYARAGLEVDANGVAGGLFLTSNGELVDLLLALDRLTIIRPGADPNDLSDDDKLFFLDGDDLFLRNVFVDRLTVGAVDGVNLALGAMGKISWWYEPAEISVTGDTWQAIASVGLTPEYGRPIRLSFSGFARCTNDASTPFFLRVVRDDGSVIYGGISGKSIRAADEGDTRPFICVDGSEIGRPTTWTVQVRRVDSSETVGFSERFLEALEMSRAKFEQFAVAPGADSGPTYGSGGGGPTFDPNFIPPGKLNP